LIDLAVQAVDGTKIAANAAGDRTYDAAGLHRLLERTEAAIAELEAQNEGGDDPPPPRLPKELQQAQELRQQVLAAMSRMAQHEGIARVNLTDEDAQLMKGRSGIMPGYNAQTMVSPLAPETSKGNGMLITAAEVVNTAADSGQLVPMLEQAEELTGQRAQVTLADGGYHTAANLEAGDRRGQLLVMAERYQGALQDPYFKDQFDYDATTDSYICPHSQRLSFRGLRRPERSSPGPIRVYRASRTACRLCPAFGVCTKDKHTGRALWIGPSDVLLRKHRRWMRTEEARSLYARRQELSEPTFGILKDQLGARRFLLRGLANVRAEFALSYSFQPPDAVASVEDAWGGISSRTEVGMPASSSRACLMSLETSAAIPDGTCMTTIRSEATAPHPTIFETGSRVERYLKRGLLVSVIYAWTNRCSPLDGGLLHDYRGERDCYNGRSLRAASPPLRKASRHFDSVAAVTPRLRETSSRSSPRSNRSTASPFRFTVIRPPRPTPINSIRSSSIQTPPS
jgi:hypothetical protein